MTPRQLEWVRPPRQTRSRRTLDRLLDAAEACLVEKGWADCSVAEITRRARSSVGSFYSRFADKDALLHALHDRFNEEALATAQAALDPRRWEGVSIADIVSESVRFQVRLYRERAPLLRAFAVRAALDPAFDERRARMDRMVVEGLTRLVLSRRREILHPEPARAGPFLYRIISGVLLMLVMGPPLGPPLFETEESLVGEITHACLSYLGVFAASTADT